MARQGEFSRKRWESVPAASVLSEDSREGSLMDVDSTDGGWINVAGMLVEKMKSLYRNIAGLFVSKFTCYILKILVPEAGLEPARYC